MIGYFRVNSQEDCDRVFRAAAFFSFMYGKPDWLESNNEYRLEQDARLRTDSYITTGADVDETDSYITTGADVDEVARFKSRSIMKAHCARARVSTVRCHRTTTEATAGDFLQAVDLSIIVKPDNGVGASDAASDALKPESDGGLARFLENLPSGPYVMEGLAQGDICSCDAIANSCCDPLFKSMAVWPPSITDVVDQKPDPACYTDAGVGGPFQSGLGRREDLRRPKRVRTSGIPSADQSPSGPWHSGGLCLPGGQYAPGRRLSLGPDEPMPQHGRSIRYGKTWSLRTAAVS